MENLKTTLEELFKFDRQLLGAGYDNALKYLDHLMGLTVTTIKSGTEFGTWTVPEEWVVKEAWVKYQGKKIIDYAQNPLSLMVYSLPFKGTISREELLKHLHFSDDLPDATPYTFKFYERDWGFSVPKNKIKAIEVDECEDCEPILKAFDPKVGKVEIEGKKGKETIKDRLEEGEYEVFIDTEFKPSLLKYGVHTIKGETDREILFFAHLDHPYQANDNLSGVVCLLDLAFKIHAMSWDEKPSHTIKIVFCPETIGSIAYVNKEDISKVDFMISVDSCGNSNSLLLNKAWDTLHRINRVAHCALQMAGKSYRKANFRGSVGSDETVFNDPLIGVPGLMLSRWPYEEYHTDWDTPDKIDYEMITETTDLVLKIIDIWEKDFVPVRKTSGPLMRSRYGLQSPSKQLNLNYDYFFYSMDGKRSLAELCAEFELNFDFMYGIITKIEADGKIRRGSNHRQRKEQKATKEK